jgi:hypothetical protein
VIKEQEEVAEGVDTAIALCELIKKSDRSYRLDLKFPIIFGVAAVLREQARSLRPPCAPARSRREIDTERPARRLRRGP